MSPFPADDLALARERGGSLRLSPGRTTARRRSTRDPTARVFFFARNDHDRYRHRHRHDRHRPAHAARRVPAPARRRRGELPARVGRAGPARALLADRLRLAAAHLRGGRASAASRSSATSPTTSSRSSSRPCRCRTPGAACPESRFVVPDVLVRFDHARGVAEVLRGDPDETLRLLESEIPRPPRESGAAHETLRLPSQAEYERGVVACKEYIRQGDAFQIVLSQRAERPTERLRARAVPEPAPRQPVAVPLPARARRHRARRLVARDARQVRGLARDAEPDRRLDAAGRGRRRAAALLREGPRGARDARRPRPQRPLARVPRRARCTSCASSSRSASRTSRTSSRRSPASWPTA